MLKMEDFQALAGKVVRFTPAIEDSEIYAERNMLARIAKFHFSPEKDEPVHWLMIDYTDFEEQNHPLQNATYYDGNGVPQLTAVEAGFYQPKEKLYIDGNLSISELPFEIIS